MVGGPFYNARYGIKYGLPNLTYILSVGIYSVEGVVKRAINHAIATHFVFVMVF